MASHNLFDLAFALVVRAEQGSAEHVQLELLEGMADPLPLSLAEVEKRHILAVLDQCGGNKTHAATLLGVSRKTLDRKAVEWGLA